MTVRISDWDLFTEVGAGVCRVATCDNAAKCPLHADCSEKSLDGFVPKLEADMIMTDSLKVRTACWSYSGLSSRGTCCFCDAEIAAGEARMRQVAGDKENIGCVAHPGCQAGEAAGDEDWVYEEAGE